MPTPYARHTSTKRTPQREPIPGKAQVKNSAGGYTFPVDVWTRLDRFLILGTEGGTYYATERDLTVENATVVREAVRVDGPRTVKTISEVSDSGRAPKNDPAVFALAIAMREGDALTKSLAAAALPVVCRIGTHLFQFVDALSALGGVTRVARKAISRWYTQKAPDALAMQVAKYQSREKWSHRDVLRLVHLNDGVFDRDGSPTAQSMAAAIRWAVKGSLDGYTTARYAAGSSAADRARALTTHAMTGALEAPLLGLTVRPPIDPARTPRVIEGFEKAKRETDPKEIAKLIGAYGLPRECVPTAALNSPDVWEALLASGMGLTAMIRNLGKMSSIGLVKPLSDAEKFIVTRLGDADALRRARVHPLAILIALKTYASGHGLRGALTWTPSQEVLAALDSAFYLAFQAVVPTGKRHLIALDVSGSMDSGSVAGAPLTPREGVGALALVTARTEEWTHLVAFTSNGSYSRPSQHFGYPAGISVVEATEKTDLNSMVKKMRRLRMGGTDCALPMIYAKDEKLTVDTFVVLTDNETWAGSIHPSQALREYRQASGINSKLIVVGMTATGFSIADPQDGGMLDVVGFDTAAPQVMADFSRGPAL